MLLFSLLLLWSSGGAAVQDPGCKCDPTADAERICTADFVAIVTAERVWYTGERGKNGEHKNTRDILLQLLQVWQAKKPLDERITILRTDDSKCGTSLDIGVPHLVTARIRDSIFLEGNACDSFYLDISNRSAEEIEQMRTVVASHCASIKKPGKYTDGPFQP